MNITTYIKTIVLDNIKKSEFANLLHDTDRYGVYMCYLWYEERNEFVFKIGRTNNIEKRLNELNSKYESNYRIILIFYGTDNNINIEKKLHAEMEEFRINTNNQNIKSRESYSITFESYERIYNFFLENINSFFECKDYEINEDGSEYYKLSDELLSYFPDSEITVNYDDENPEDDNIPFLKLNSTNIENFWKFNYNLYGKWKSDDGKCDLDDNYDKDIEELVVDSDFELDDKSNNESDSDDDSVVDSNDDKIDNDESSDDESSDNDSIAPPAKYRKINL